MESFFKLQINKYGETMPDWFDWLSLIVSLLAIIGTYLISRNIFRKEIKHKKEEDEKLQEFEIELFKINIRNLLSPIEKQINSLNAYVNGYFYKIDYNQSVQVNFLDIIDLKNLYKKAGLENNKGIIQINKLIDMLFTIKDFRSSLFEEIKYYETRKNYFHEKFLDYRKILYTKYYSSVNSFLKDEKNGNPKFLLEYNKLCGNIHKNPSIINNRQEFIDKFILPLITETMKDEIILEDIRAIEVNEIANNVKSAYDNMTLIDDTHKTNINNYIDGLNNVKSEINTYLE